MFLQMPESMFLIIKQMDTKFEDVRCDYGKTFGNLEFIGFKKQTNESEVSTEPSESEEEPMSPLNLS